MVRGILKKTSLIPESQTQDKKQEEQESYHVESHLPWNKMVNKRKHKKSSQPIVLYEPQQKRQRKGVKRVHWADGDLLCETIRINRHQPVDPNISLSDIDSDNEEFSEKLELACNQRTFGDYFIRDEKMGDTFEGDEYSENGSQKPWELITTQPPKPKPGLKYRFQFSATEQTTIISGDYIPQDIWGGSNLVNQQGKDSKDQSDDNFIKPKEQKSNEPKISNNFDELNDKQQSGASQSPAQKNTNEEQNSNQFYCDTCQAVIILSEIRFECLDCSGEKCFCAQCKKLQPRVHPHNLVANCGPYHFTSLLCS